MRPQLTSAFSHWVRANVFIACLIFPPLTSPPAVHSHYTASIHCLSFYISRLVCHTSLSPPCERSFITHTLPQPTLLSRTSVRSVVHFSQCVNNSVSFDPSEFFYIISINIRLELRGSMQNTILARDHQREQHAPTSLSSRCCLREVNVLTAGNRFQTLVYNSPHATGNMSGKRAITHTQTRTYHLSQGGCFAPQRPSKMPFLRPSNCVRKG